MPVPQVKSRPESAPAFASFIQAARPAASRRGVSGKMVSRLRTLRSSVLIPARALSKARCVLFMAAELKDCRDAPFVFKASFDKANRIHQFLSRPGWTKVKLFSEIAIPFVR
jgi:hypothetical protein